MVMSRALCRQVVPHVLAAWLVAFFLTFGHACLAQGRHAAPPEGNASLAQPHDDPAFPSDCARFCNDDTPLAGTDPAPDFAWSATGAFPVARDGHAFAPIECVVRGRPRQTQPLGAAHVAVLQRSRRLAL